VVREEVAVGSRIQPDTGSGWGAITMTDAEARGGELLTVRQVADLLQVSVSTVERMTRRGEGPPSIKFGRSRRWLRRDVERWLEEHREGG
jgi:excisionase family DNA binding protein